MSKNVRETGPKFFWNVRELFLVRFDRLCEKKFVLLESSSFAKDWQIIVTWGNAILSRRFLGGFVVFLQSWMFLQSYGGLQIFVQNYFANFSQSKISIDLQGHSSSIISFVKLYCYKSARICTKSVPKFVRIWAKKMFLQFLFNISFRLQSYSSFLQVSSVIV